MLKPELTRAKEMSLQLLLAFAVKKWQMAAQFFLATVIVFLAIYVFIVPYSATSIFLINDAQTSPSQAFSNNFFALSKTQTNSRKNQTSSATAIDFLSRQNSMLNFAKTLTNPKNSFNAEEKTTFDRLASRWKSAGNSSGTSPEINWKRAAKELTSMIKFNSSSPSELQISVRAGNKDLSEFLITQYSKYAMESMKNQEKQEIAHVREALVGQREHFRSNFEVANKELVAFQSRPENVFSLTSGSSLGNYISDLVARKNDIDLKIAENERLLSDLGGKTAIALAAKRKLGDRSQALQLQESTRLLKKERISVQASIKKFTTASNGYAEALRMHDELKKVTQREFTNFQETNDLLSKLDVYEISIASKFEILHSPEPEEIQKAVSLYLILALAVFLSQLIFAGYLYYNFHQEPPPVLASVPNELPLAKKPLLQASSKNQAVAERETFH